MRGAAPRCPSASNGRGWPRAPGFAHVSMPKCAGYFPPQRPFLAPFSAGRLQPRPPRSAAKPSLPPPPRSRRDQLSTMATGRRPCESSLPSASRSQCSRPRSPPPPSTLKPGRQSRGFPRPINLPRRHLRTLLPRHFPVRLRRALAGPKATKHRLSAASASLSRSGQTGQGKTAISGCRGLSCRPQI